MSVDTQTMGAAKMKALKEIISKMRQMEAAGLTEESAEKKEEGRETVEERAEGEHDLHMGDSPHPGVGKDGEKPAAQMSPEDDEEFQAHKQEFMKRNSRNPEIGHKTILAIGVGVEPKKAGPPGHKFGSDVGSDKRKAGRPKRY